MVEIFKTIDNKLTAIEDIQYNSWINVVNPTEAEIKNLATSLNVEEDFIRASLDLEERARFEQDEDSKTILIVIDFPFAEFERDSRIYETIPLGIIYSDEVVVTICSNESLVLQNFRYDKVKTFTTTKKARFILQILYKVASLYLEYLKQIDKHSEVIQSELEQSPQNKEILQLLDLQKSLVYFSTSLRSNELVFERLKRLDVIKRHEEDFDLIEDIIIENSQALEMAKIYTNILSNIMGAYSSVMSNNLSYVMKYLTSVTILLSIPTIISSFYGMNVDVPFGNSEDAFIIIVLLTLVVGFIIGFIMNRKKLF